MYVCIYIYIYMHLCFPRGVRLSQPEGSAGVSLTRDSSIARAPQSPFKMHLYLNMIYGSDENIY